MNGVIVFNTGTGQTKSGQGQQVNVRPGFYYFSNPNGSSSNKIGLGRWVPMEEIQTGTGTPSSTTTSQAGEIYVDRSTGDIYTFDGTQWNLKAGGTGTDSQTLAFDTATASLTIDAGNTVSLLTLDDIQTGTGSPTSTGSAGDVYVDTATGNLYTWNGSSWSQLGSGQGSPWFGTDDNAAATDNTEDIYVLSQRVGIGTTLPSKTLTVSGTARITGLSVDTSATTSLVIVDATGELKSSERFWFKGGVTRIANTTNLLSSTMTASQPTTYGSSTANRAINGSTSSSDRSLTGQQVYPWWKLDMGSNITLNRLKFYHYLSSHFRLSNFYVVFSQNDISLPTTPTATDLNNLINATGNTAIHYTGQIPNQSGDVTFDELTARYMIVVRDISTADYLQIAEVQAFKDDIIPSDGIGTPKIKVGIGTTSPTETLTVSGTVQITDLASGTTSDDVIVVDSSGVLKKIAANSLTGTDSQTLSFDAATASLTIDAGNSVSLLTLDDIQTGTGTPTSTGQAGDVYLDTNTGDLYTWDANNNRWVQVGSNNTNAWSILGNTGTDSSTNFIGTTDAQTLVVKTNNATRLIVPSETTSDTRLLFANAGDFNPLSFPTPSLNSAVLGIEGTNHSRLRLTAGNSDTQSGALGASIDLHGNQAGWNAGVLDLVAGSTASSTTAAIRFWTYAGTQQQTAAVMTGAGHFGLGTTTPGETLTVSGTAQITGLSAATGTASVVVASANGVLQKQSIADLIPGPWFGDDDDATATSNTEDIYQLGRVGVGVNDPAGRLHITPSGAEEALLVGRISGRANIKAHGSNQWLIMDAASGIGNVGLAYYEASDVVLNQAGGNTGIGIAAPTQKLDVNGQTRIRTLNTASSTVSVVVADSDGVLQTVSLTDIAREPWRTGNDQAATDTTTGTIYYEGAEVSIGTASNTATFRTTGAVYGKYREHNASTSPVWTDDDYIMILKDENVHGNLRLPDATLPQNLGRIIIIRDDTASDLNFETSGGVKFYPDQNSRLHARSGAVFISDGTTWQAIAYRI